MAFTDDTTGGRVIEQGWGAMKLTLSEDVKCGDLIGDSSNTWKLADGNNSIYAEFIAGTIGASGDEITVYRAAVISGITTGVITQVLYLKDDKGEYSKDMGTVGQVVGQELGGGRMYICPNFEMIGGQRIPDAVKLFFRDSGLFIQSSADGKLTISADGAGADDIAMSGTVTLNDYETHPTGKGLRGDTGDNKTLSIAVSSGTGTAFQDIIKVSSATLLAKGELGFHNKTPVAQSAAKAQATATSAYNSTMGTRINDILTLLKDVGLMTAT